MTSTSGLRRPLWRYGRAARRAHSTKCSVLRSAMTIVVACGFTPGESGIRLASLTYRLVNPFTLPKELVAQKSGFSPIGALLKACTVERLIADTGMYVFKNPLHCSADLRPGKPRNDGYTAVAPAAKRSSPRCARPILMLR